MLKPFDKMLDFHQNLQCDKAGSADCLHLCKAGVSLGKLTSVKIVGKSKTSSIHLICLGLGLYFWFFGIFGFPVDPSKATICTSCTLCMLEFSNVFHLAAILSILWLRQETYFSK